MVTKMTESDEDGEGGSDIDLQYTFVVSQEAISQYNSSSDEEACYERKQLLGGERPSRTRTNSTIATPTRHRSISRSISVSQASTFSVWNLTRTQKVVIVTTSLCDFLAYLSVSLMAPFFPEEALKKGVSDTLSGWIFGIAPFTQFLISPVFGKLIPLVGVKFMFIAGVFTYGGCTLLFGMLSYVPVTNGYGIFITLAFLLQVFKSIGVACSSTASFVLMMQEFPDNVATVFGLGEVFVGLGLVMGPAVGGLLYGLDGFYLPFVSIGVIALINIPFLLWAVPSVTNAELHTGKENLPLRKILCSPKGALISASIITSTVMWSILDPTLEPHLRQFNMTPELVGVIFLVMAAVYAISAPIWGWMSDKLDDKRMLLFVGFVGASIGSLLIGPSPLLGFAINFNELWLIVLALVILGASASLSSVPTFDMYFTLAEDLGYEDDTRTYSMVAGLWMSMYSLGDFLGPSAGGVLLDTVGFSSMCTYTAGVCLLMAIIILISKLCDIKCHTNGFRRTPVKQEYKTTQQINQAYDSYKDHPCYGSSGHTSMSG